MASWLLTDREQAMNSYNAPDSVNQVASGFNQWETESIEFIRQIIRLKHKDVLSYHRHVFVHTAANSGWIVYEIHGGLEHLLVVFNAKGLPLLWKCGEILKCWCPIVVLKV